MPKYFITGTGTDVGKTVVATVLCVGLKAKYWKPIQTGPAEMYDASFVSAWGESKNIIATAYTFSAPSSPDAAATEEGREIDLETIPTPDEPNLIIEGAGGLLVPLNTRHTIADLMSKLQAPVIIVAKPDLGTINHTLLTIEAIRRRKLPLAGLIFSGPAPKKTEDSIRHHGKIAIIGSIPRAERFTHSWFETAFNSLDQSALRDVNVR